MNHYVTLAMTNRKSSVHLHALYSPPHCTKDVYTPQGPSHGLSTLAVTVLLWYQQSYVDRNMGSGVQAPLKTWGFI
jgi:hypothetical protein